ncbi:hypothetical protein, conserved [Leishmania tarentolae]|uniref:Guanine nucleotide-binding protein subunit beta-like protein n=1 Tax=Leishmania tarentolae TaxID=5689 RepID=A0A640KFT7_LEITA|nr:hypothetical protein, conserved [Leishmania tarentolae]
MPLLSSCHAPQSTVRRRASSRSRSQGIQASVRPSASCVGSAGPSRQAVATGPLMQPALNCEVPPCASPSKLISTATTSTLLPPLEDFVTDADDALPIAVLTSAALAEPYAQSEGRARASSWPPSCGGSDKSLDDDFTAVPTLLFHTAEQQRPSVESVIGMSRGSSPCPISARRHSAPLFQNRATSYSATKAKGRISFLPSQHAGALPSPWLSSFSHLRPLQSSKEADYLNLAYQRSFLGRFRCATPVVIRTSTKVTLHENVAPATSDDSAPSHRQGGNVQKETTASSVCASAGNVTGEGDHTSPSPAAHGHTQGLDAEEPHPADVSSLRAVSVGHSSSLAEMGRSQRKLGCQRSVSGVSISSSVTAGRGARRGRSASVINGGHPRGLLPSSASAVVRSTGATSSAGLKGRPFAGRGGLRPTNMEPLVKSGLHTSLWLAQHDGGLEVRSMANPNQVLASLPRRDPQAIITSLTEVCGNRVVAGYTDGTLCVYDAVTMKKTAEQRTHTAAVTCLLYVQGAPRVPVHTSADTEHRRNHGSALTQSLLLTGSLDHSIGVWDAASMSYLHKLRGSLRSIGALAATATGGYAFSGSDDGTLRMWDVVQGEQLTITKEERVHAVKRVNEMGLVTSTDLPRQLGVASTLVPAAAGQSSSAVPFSGLHRRDAEADGEVGGDKSAASSSRAFQHPLLNSAPRNSHVLAAPGAPRPSISFPVIDRRCHRFRKGSGAAKKRPRNRSTGAHEGSTTTPALHLLTKVADGGSPVPSRLSFSCIPSAEVGVFETTEARTTSSSAREGGMLAGLQGSIFGPHGGSEQGAAFEDEDDRRAVAGSAAVGDALHRDTSRDPFATPRTPRSLKRDIKKRAKCLQGKQHAGTTLTIGGRGAKKAKAKHSSPAPMVGVPPKREKGAPKRVTQSATPATESKPTRTRRFGSLLEQRLESWLHLYQQRVLLSAASLQFTQRISAGYDTAATFSWPIECAHTECVTALTVVEDRLLVSASRDATAKVFALPSGQYVRTLASSRRMPLSSVLYDPSVGRLYTAFVDGGLAVYDTHCGELPLLSQAQPPYTILSSTFVPLRMTPMRRFVWSASVRGEETPDSPRNGNGGLSSVVMCAAQFDRTTMAHGPNQTATSYRVGQPSLRELNAAVSLQPLQQQRVLNLAKQAKQETHDMLEEQELSNMRRCGLILAREYVHRQSYCVFARWRQWAQRRELHSAFKGAVAARAESYAMALLARYRQRWLNWTRARKKMSASKALQKVQLQASDVVLLAVSNEVREGYRRVWTLMADSMKRRQRITLLACAYSHWRDFLRARQAHVRQCVSFNKLLLSLNASSSTPVSCTWGQLIPKAMQAATRARALWLLTEKTQSSRAQAHRRRCFDLWRMCAQQRRRVTASAAESRKWGVETLSASLVQPWKLRRRYFALWQDFALYVTRSERLASERDTLGVVWATWQKTAKNPISARKLQEKLSAAESSMAATEAEVKRLEARLKTVSSEVAVMRTEAALRMLIAGYCIPSVVHAAPLPSASTASAMTETSSMASLRRGSLASSASTGLSNGGGCSGAMAWCHTPKATGADRTEEERAQRQEEDKLLFEVSAVLRALKGKAMQYDRDDKLLSTAHTLALKLPIYEPAHHARASFESGAGRQATLSAQHQRVPRRRSSWSVSNVKSGGQIIVPEHNSSSPPPPQQQQPSFFVGDPTGGASLSVPTVALSSTSATTRNASSAAQMWAAQPAEETYTCLADAFTAVYVNLRALLHAAALECGAPAQMVSGMAGASAEDDLAGHVRASWITQVPLKQRRVMIGEVMKLVMLFDSFTAHNDLPVECAGSISKRGSVNTRAMPLCSLCSRDTATSLLENASVLLELVDPHLWSRQIKLNHLQDAYAAAIAELNAAVSSASFNDTVPRHSSAATLSSAITAEQGASPPPTPLQMRPPLLLLSEDVLQEAKLAVLKHDATTLDTTNAYCPLSIDRGTNHSPSSVHSGLTQTTPLSSAGAYTPVRVHSTDGPLNVSNSLEEGSATPTAEPRRLRHRSTSHHSYLGVQTPRSYTPRTATQLMAGAGPNGMLVKPYLGFRVNVNRETETMQRTTINIRDVIPHYVNTEGEDVEGPAQVAGLQVGDQLVRFAGYAVTDLAAFNAVVSRHVHPGAELPVVILRSGEQLCKTIVVGSRAAPGA